MDRWILALALAALFAIGGFWFLLNTSRKQSVPVDDNGRLTLRHGKLFWTYACGLFLGLEILIGSLALFFPLTSPLANGLLICVAVIAAILGIVLIWDAYRFQMMITSEGLDCHSPWRGPSQIPWNEIQNISFSTANLWFEVKPKTGDTFHVMAIVPGVQQFLASCEANLPVEKLVAAEEGYDWVWRKFPYMKNKPPRPRSRIRKYIFIVCGIATAVVLLTFGLFCWNGLILAAGEKPVVREITLNDPAKSGGAKNQVVVLSYNIAKAFAHREGFQFEEPSRVTARLNLIAQAIQLAQPDIVCLSEVMTEAGTMPVDQLEYLAKATKLPYMAFGENYNFGIPGYRVVGGNAILSRTPLTPIANISLVGRKPFYVTRNNRRALFAETRIHGETVLVGSLHNDSFDSTNNDAQMKQILEFVSSQPCILAGDFNAKPDSNTLKQIDDSMRFSGVIKGRPTFPAHNPEQRIDYIFGPAEWTHNGTDVLISEASDHRPVVSIFTVPEKK